MNFPETFLQIGFVLLMVVPGIVFTAVRRKLRGPTPEDQDFSVRLINAIAASVVFACIYLVAFGPSLIRWVRPTIEEGQSFEDAPQRLAADNPRMFGFAVLALAVLVPAFVGVLAHLRSPGWQWVNWTRAAAGRSINKVLRLRVSSSPSAWDEVAPLRADCFVRIYTADSRWVGGYIPSDSGYVSTYPHPRDIFITQQWRMNDEGEFVERIQGSLGIYVPLNGDERVEWIQPEEDGENPDQLSLF